MSYYLGILQSPNEIKIALLSFNNHTLKVEKVQKTPLDVNPLDILEKDFLGRNVQIITGLKAEEVIRKDILLKLKKEKKILEVLPFQVENVIPFPKKETIVLPFLDRKENSTALSLFATKKSYLEKLLSSFANRGLDPDIVSSTYAALFRWVKWTHPSLEEFAIIHESTCVVVSNNKIVATHPVQEGDQKRLKAYLSSKFPHIPLLHFEHPLLEFAIPIGFALEGIFFHNGTSLQFRQKEYLSLKKIADQKKTTFRYILISFLLAAAIFCAGFLFSYIQEKKLDKKLSLSFSLQKSLSLEEKIRQAEVSLEQYRKIFPFFPNVYSVSEALSFFSTYQDPIEITHFHYVLEQFSSLEKKENPYTVKVELIFKAENPSVANKFVQFLKKEAPLVNTKKEISWIPSEESYKISFYLQGKSYVVK